MFNELKEQKYFKEITDLEITEITYFKERKRVRSLQKAEAYLEPKQGSTITLFSQWKLDHRCSTAFI